MVFRNLRAIKFNSRKSRLSYRMSVPEPYPNFNDQRHRASNSIAPNRVGGVVIVLNFDFPAELLRSNVYLAGNASVCSDLTAPTVSAEDCEELFCSDPEEYSCGDPSGSNITPSSDPGILSDSSWATEAVFSDQPPYSSVGNPVKVKQYPHPGKRILEERAQEQQQKKKRSDPVELGDSDDSSSYPLEEPSADIKKWRAVLNCDWYQPSSGRSSPATVKTTVDSCDLPPQRSSLDSAIESFYENLHAIGL